MAVACRNTCTYFRPQFHPFVIRLIFHLFIFLYIDFIWFSFAMLLPNEVMFSMCL